MSHVIADSAVMLRRDLKHMLRFPLMTISGIGTATLMLLLFHYVFGGAVGAAADGAYIDYLVPGILLMAIGGGGSATALNVNADMREGLITRLRTMAVPRIAVLSGQVGGSMIRTLLSLLLVVGIAFACGFRPQATAAGWLAIAGLLALATFAVSWITCAFGIVAKTEAGANSLSLLFTFGTFVSSAFVPTEAMSPGARWIAEHQPLTPLMDTVRNLLAGLPAGDGWLPAVLWWTLLSIAGILWSRAVFNRLPAR
ncbi:ABC transporter permease [Actinoplanes utahensis]|uniref:Transport permease protein n=1 Tax=Actinoplanes utahensis TaxID=1869 RepID=A0A0A6UIR3_ACTUT|nr:ABC transporter permease [Actinoplanes utahensis]KHD75296.1 ABC transporter permease [Actinoplanes utahensis]GIF30449.1 transport permease protein [Actinoplanes utahensis]